MVRKEALDRKAVNERIEGLRDRLVDKAYRGLGDAEEAEDAVQDTCASIWENLQQLRDLECFDAWAFAILRNTVLNRYRSRAKALRPHSLDTDGIGNAIAEPGEAKSWERQHHAKTLIETLAGQLPPILAEYVKGTIEGLDKSRQAEPSSKEKHRLRRSQERLKEWIWRAVGMETELVFVRRIENFVSSPCPQNSDALLAAAEKEDQIKFAHFILALYHLGTARGLANKLARDQLRATPAIEVNESVVNGVLLHANLALQSADLIRDPFFRATAHELVADALFKKAESRCNSVQEPDIEEIAVNLQAAADEWGAAADFYAEAEAIEAMAWTCFCQAVVLKNIGQCPAASQILEQTRRICLRHGYKVAAEGLCLQMEKAGEHRSSFRDSGFSGIDEA